MLIICKNFVTILEAAPVTLNESFKVNFQHAFINNKTSFLITSDVLLNPFIKYTLFEIVYDLIK